MDKVAINYWMSNGFRIPGWIIVRPELSLDAKVLYGFILDEIDIWMGQRDQTEHGDIMHPLWKPVEIAGMLQWDMEQFADARDELLKHKLFYFVLPVNMERDKGYFRFGVVGTHPWWGESCFMPVTDDEEGEQG